MDQPGGMDPNTRQKIEQNTHEFMDGLLRGTRRQAIKNLISELRMKGTKQIYFLRLLEVLSEE